MDTLEEVMMKQVKLREIQLVLAFMAFMAFMAVAVAG
jgi:hypothetical protein